MTVADAVRAALTTDQEIEDLLGRPVSAVMMKQIDHVDRATAPVLMCSPIAGFGYQDAGGTRRGTLVGDGPGFLQVLSPQRIALQLPAGQPEPATGSGVSFVFLFPGVSETLRLNGRMLKRDGTRAVVQVEEMFVHCARAVGRARLWQPAAGRAAPREGIAEGSLKDPAVRDFLAVAPFLLCTSGNAPTDSDTSPRGDRPGFVQVLDGHTLAIPDRRGNRRADTLHNLLRDDRIALTVLVPGRDQVLNVTGRATVTTDPDLLAGMALRGMAPHAALLVRVEQAVLDDSPAVRRARLWDQTAHVDQNSIPDLNVLAAGHLAANPAVRGGPLIRALAALLRRHPNLTRRLMGRQTGSALEKEGYTATAEPAPSRRPSGLVRRLEVLAVRRETPDAVTLVLSDGAAVDFAPGQFFTVSTEVDGRVLRRAYSASGAPGSGELEITVRRAGVFSTHVNEKVRPGDVFEVRGPFGSLFGPAGDGDVVMIAAGSGVTPMMSAIRARTATGDGARMLLLHGDRDEQALIFSAELARLTRENAGRLDVTHQLTRPGADWAGRTGRITGESLRHWLARVRPSADARYHLCGPGPMMDVCRQALLDGGVPDERIRTESFSGAVDDAVPGTGLTHRMRVVDAGADIGSAEIPSGETVLDAGLAAGLPMPYSCTVGNCGECVVKLLGGRVRMSEPNCLSEAQKADGYVLTCVGRANSEITVDIADL
ncbi:2Fe-2S iron-sulfur cluster binding domain-containing protein [Kineosporia sp. J2-2]|uniref:2Fe-2S iron-sulfur cluster binding domain-containing protein n=1 Tax=Kineosporia corallincola TaxID=2835133 RepID=A0ABS5TK14_9ACTN|nr:2Fe-2S iron-sulfur cluster-binding protein [Kineosporia corallincola]MBT0769914.1 2Fe-2S iron-sulfur cluster binding domain-containing protein [Kineosporia corallincola]